MKCIVVKGGKRLSGTAEVPAAKNSVLPILAASVLCKKDCIIKNVPKLTDTDVAVDILRLLGCGVYRDQHIHVTPAKQLKCEIPAYLMQSMRSSVFFLAPILCIAKKAIITYPGGCDLGARPIDIHLDGLTALGAEIIIDKNGRVQCIAQNGLTGTTFKLRLPSVGATETLVMAASVAKGRTILQNTAAEPEIQDLIAFLNSMGAHITQPSANTIIIDGVQQLCGGVYTPMPDRIVASTIICGTAAAGGTVFIKGARLVHVAALADILNMAGAQISCERGGLLVSCEKQLSGIGTVQTGVYPQFATDAAPLLAAAMLKSKGNTIITDTIFEKRFECANGFNLMGANTKVDKNAIIITGASVLQGANVAAKDLRGGAALVLAAMACKGQSIITGCDFISRGYENIASVFLNLGADIYAY